MEPDWQDKQTGWDLHTRLPSTSRMRVEHRRSHRLRIRGTGILLERREMRGTEVVGNWRRQKCSLAGRLG